MLPYLSFNLLPPEQIFCYSSLRSTFHSLNSQIVGLERMLLTALRDNIRARGWEERKSKSPPPPLTPPQKQRTNTRWESRSLWQLTSGLQGESHTSPRLPQLALAHTHMLGALQSWLWVVTIILFKMISRATSSC